MQCGNKKSALMAVLTDYGHQMTIFFKYLSQIFWTFGQIGRLKPNTSACPNPTTYDCSLYSKKLFRNHHSWIWTSRCIRLKFPCPWFCINGSFFLQKVKKLRFLFGIDIWIWPVENFGSSVHILWMFWWLDKWNVSPLLFLACFSKTNFATWCLDFAQIYQKKRSLSGPQLLYNCNGVL